MGRAFNAGHSYIQHRIDLLHPGSVHDLIVSVRPDVVHHLAAQSSVASSLRDPIGTLTQNASAQYNVLEAVGACAPDARVLIAGSCDEYGEVAAEENPVSEEQPLRPLNPYALSKVAQDLMGYQYHVVKHLNVIRVRPFLQVGPRRSDRFVAGSFARQVAEVEAGIREPIVNVGNIDLVRDFTDVRDVAEALALIIERGEVGSVYNIASGEGHTLREMLEIMKNHIALPLTIRSTADRRRPGEPPILLGDASRLCALTGWRPAISFEQSVHDTLDYWRRRIKDSRGAEDTRP
ncbi:MAG: GDP-mannose 4,6-dehydratase [Chloroflexota bacterium]